MQGQAYTDAGATAYDAVDGALNDVITSGLSSIDTMVVSRMLVLYQHLDTDAAVSAIFG